MAAGSPTVFAIAEWPSGSPYAINVDVLRSYLNLKVAIFSSDIIDYKLPSSRLPKLFQTRDA